MRRAGFATAAVSAALCVALLSGCGGSSNSPTNVSFDTSTGDLTFNAVKDADTYTAGVSLVLNDATGEALQSINGSAQVSLDDGSSVYVWSEQTGSVSGLSDSDGDGKVDGTIVFREFSSSATKVGDVISTDQLPVGHYVLQVVPAATDKLTNPEPSVTEFTISGTLATPEGFSARINDDGVMEVTAPSDYYLSCLTKTGLPTEMKFEVKDGDSVVDTFTVDDFSYTNSVNGPNKSFAFNNAVATGTQKLDSSKSYTVTVTAVGDGDQIKDASAEAYMETSTPETRLSSTYDTSGSATVGDLSLTVTLGKDASGTDTYTLDATVNDIPIYRESGTFTSSAPAQDIDGKDTFPEGSVLTFKSASSDFSSAVLDGANLTVAASTQSGPLPPGMSAGTTYYLSGNATVDGEQAEFAQPSGGMFPGAPQ